MNIINFTCEYNENSNVIKSPFTLNIGISISSKSQFKCNDSDTTLHKDKIIWCINDLDNSKQPSLEIKTTENPVNMFPLMVHFKLNYSLLGISAKAIDENNEEMLIAFNPTCESQNFVISFE